VHNLGKNVHYDYLYAVPFLSTMHIGKNIRKIREQKGLMQKEVASAAAIHTSNYSKIEKGEREPSIEALDKIATLFDMTVDQIIHFEGKMPREVKIKDKTATEKLQLIEQLDDEDKQAVYRIIDGMLTKSKFKDFFQKNVAAL
jgi:transcriptional regulator with XRE-family HTH domain